MEDRNRWIELIKNLRIEHNVSIIDAERIALADGTWRRWVESQIKSEKQCRRMALSHIRYLGEAGLIERDGDTLKIR